MRGFSGCCRHRGWGALIGCRWCCAAIEVFWPVHGGGVSPAARSTRLFINTQHSWGADQTHQIKQLRCVQRESDLSHSSSSVCMSSPLLPFGERQLQLRQDTQKPWLDALISRIDSRCEFMSVFSPQRYWWVAVHFHLCTAALLLSSRLFCVIRKLTKPTTDLHFFFTWQEKTNSYSLFAVLCFVFPDIGYLAKADWKKK